MSTALESNNTSREMRDIKPRGFACVATAAIFESLPAVGRRPVTVDGEEANEWSSSSLAASSSSTTSSIGKNSDASSDGENCGEENEVQSAFKGTLDAMDSLEDVLPLRRGISKFYNGKSKSFTSLAEASSSSSIKEIAKPENAYTRRCRNLLAFNHVWDRNRSFPHRSNGGGISKRPISWSKSALALAVAMSSSESISSTSEDSSSSPLSKSPPHLPPLHPRSRTYHHNLVSLPSRWPTPWQSSSVADLQQCAAAADKTYG